MQHNKNKALLALIHKNASMGISSIPMAMSMPQSRAMTQSLDSQLREYRTIAARAQAAARQQGKSLKGPGTALRTMSGAMLQAKTTANPSTSYLAQLMIEGSTMGTVQMTRNLHRYAGRADQSILDLGQRLLKTEERNIEEMKRFL